MASKFSIRVNIDTAKLDKFAEEARMSVIDETARELAAEVLARAIENLEEKVYTRPNEQVEADRVSLVPEPTGALINSGYLRTFTGKLPDGVKSQAEAEAAAKAKQSGVTFGQSPPGPSRLGVAQILFATEYAIIVEMGSIRGMVARPYLEPALRSIRPLVADFAKAKFIKAGFE